MLNFGITFSEAISKYKFSNNKNLFEDIITIQTIEEDSNLSQDDKNKLLDIINSDIDKFEKRLRIMRTLDKEKEFSSKIIMILKDRPSKMELSEKILNIFRDYYVKNDVLKKEFGEVLTKLETVNQMLDEIDPDFWTTPYNNDGSIKRILEPANGSGIFAWSCIVRFMNGLIQYFPNENDRYKFIIENMIYVVELQKSKMFNWLCIADLYDEYDLNVYCGSFLEKGFDEHFSQVWGLKEGDIALCASNPPYQINIKGNNRSKPLYNHFIEKSLILSEKTLFITPSRWLYGGFNLDNFRDMMFKRKDIKLIKHFNNSKEIFGNNVDIVGGISYILIDKKYNGLTNFNGCNYNLDKYDIFVDPKYSTIIDKVAKFDSLSKISKSKSFWMNFNDNELDKTSSSDNILCYVSQQKGLKKFIKKDKIAKSSKGYLSKYKIFTPSANGECPCFGNKIIGYPNETASNTYITLIVDTEKEAISLLTYMNTYFCNFLLSLRKSTQNMKPDTMKWIPMVPLDRQWTDAKLFEYFNISECEQDLIFNKKSISLINEDSGILIRSYGYEIISDNYIEKIRLSIPTECTNNNCICRDIIKDFDSNNENKWILKINDKYYYIVNQSIYKTNPDGNMEVCYIKGKRYLFDKKYSSKFLYYDFLIYKIDNINQLRDLKMKTILC